MPGPADSVSSADHLIILLRQKLRERSRLAGKDKSLSRSGTEAEPFGIKAIQALIAAKSADQGLLRRALVQNLMAEQFGQDMINDAQFQQIVSRVTDAIEEDADASILIARVLSELKAP
jgi:hypothetical protein